jgi:hypothetical protein
MRKTPKNPPLPTLPFSPTLVSENVAKQFATVVIEVPRITYHSQSKTSMRVASKKAGGANYPGPLRLYMPRWKHIHTFYVFELSRSNFYQAISLTNHPHYSVLSSEMADFEYALDKFKSQNRSIKIKKIKSNENFQDDFLVVINDFSEFPEIQRFVNTVDDSYLLCEVISTAKLDKNRGNWKLDFGYACGQNLERDLNEFGTTRPRLLERTKEPMVLEIQKDLSLMSDLVSSEFGLPQFHRVGNIHKDYAAKLHPQGIFPAWRAAGHGPFSYVEIHEDSLNDSRPLMSPVGVLSKIYQTNDGPIRLTKIGYSRQSLLDAINREADIKPVVKEFKEWEKAQPDLAKVVSNDLLKIRPNSDLPGVIEIPTHLERSVGVSPYIYATIHLQKCLSLSRQQCVGILYNCVTSESPYYFYATFQHIMLLPAHERKILSDMSPVALGLWFHNHIWKLIEKKQSSNDKRVFPRRHQPHNGKRTRDVNITMSVINLLRLVDQYCFLDGAECQKQFHHSKAIAILMMPARAGGCHACGGLTSQTLLYTLACVGLIPICVTRWGELAGTETAGFLERHYQLSYADGRAEQFLSCAVACSPGLTPEQIEHRTCKWTRWKKRQMRGKADTEKVAFRDGIWPGQYLYQPIDGQLAVWTESGRRLVKPPALDWPNLRGKRSQSDQIFWEQPTRSAKKRVLGGNRRRKRRVEKIITLTLQQVQVSIPSSLEIVYQSACVPLFLSMNNVLGDVLGEGSSVPNSRILAMSIRRKKGFRFGLLDANESHVSLPPSFQVYPYARLCKAEGALLYSLTVAPLILAKHVFRLIETDKAANQVLGRDRNGSGDYFLIHDGNGRRKNKRLVLAVVKFLSTKRILFVLHNSEYGSDSMNFTFLDKP